MGEAHKKVYRPNRYSQNCVLSVFILLCSDPIVRSSQGSEGRKNRLIVVVAKCAHVEKRRKY